MSTQNKQTPVTDVQMLNYVSLNQLKTKQNQSSTSPTGKAKQLQQVSQWVRNI